ncbi:hypothetical protein CDIK_3413 [Cucumispora dikerogammari]|nr:hypothetical protein CDIK_3413 [Cucumispora dikerogammari]
MLITQIKTTIAAFYFGEDHQQALDNLLVQKYTATLNVREAEWVTTMLQNNQIQEDRQFIKGMSVVAKLALQGFISGVNDIFIYKKLEDADVQSFFILMKEIICFSERVKSKMSHGLIEIKNRSGGYLNEETQEAIDTVIIIIGLVLSVSESSMSSWCNEIISNKFPHLIHHETETAKHQLNNATVTFYQNIRRRMLEATTGLFPEFYS